jgi:hypothetical protein
LTTRRPGRSITSLELACPCLPLLQEHCSGGGGSLGSRLEPLQLAALGGLGEARVLQALRAGERSGEGSSTLLRHLREAASGRTARSRSRGRSRGRRRASPSPAHEQRCGFQRLLDRCAPGDPLLRTALQNLQQQRPELACQLDGRNLQHLCRMHQAPALLAVHQLLLSEPKACRPGAPFPPFATDTFHKIDNFFAVAPEHSPDRDPGLWERIAAGEVGSPVPHCLTCWDGPESVKAWLQVGGAAGRLAAVRVPACLVVASAPGGCC